MVRHVRWRWEQGREAYWRFQNITDLSRGLLELDGVQLSGSEDPLTVLRECTELPFKTPPAQADYTVWRQYARVIRCLLLATKRDDRLAISDICKRLAGEDSLTVDDFLFMFAVRFYCPPLFGTDYEPTQVRVYPICALLKFLLANVSDEGRSKIDLPTIFSLLIGNACVGNEPLEHYRHLPGSEHAPSGNDELRQVRELITFIAQFTFLLWDGTQLHLELPSKAHSKTIESRLQPLDSEPEPDRDSELISLGRTTDQEQQDCGLTPLIAPSVEDMLFLEGSKTRITHLVTERNRKLRENYMKFRASQKTPILCDFRGCDVQSLYPWTDNLLEVHHMLPLSSGMIVEIAGTSFEHLTAVCPSCHRAIHCYYRLWLSERKKKDFASSSEASIAFREAKSRLTI